MKSGQVPPRISEATRLGIIRRPRLIRMRARRLAAVEREIQRKLGAYNLLRRIYFRVEYDAPGEAWRLVRELMYELENEADALCYELWGASNAYVEALKPGGESFGLGDSPRPNATRG